MNSIFETTEYGLMLLNNEMVDSDAFEIIEDDYKPYYGTSISKAMIDFFKIEQTENTYAFSGFEEVLQYINWEDGILNMKTKKLSKKMRDKVLQMVSIISNNYYKDGDKIQDYKNIYSSTFKTISRDHYSKLLKSLMNGTKKFGSIIECDNSYCNDINEKYKKAKGYKLSDKYRVRKTKLINYHEPKTINSQLDVKGSLEAIRTNFICRSLIETYPRVKLPTPKEVEQRALELNSVEYNKTYKKVLVFEKDYCKHNNIKLSKFQKHTKDKNISSLNRDVNWYKSQYLKGFTVPKISKNGYYRVSDLITRLPKWIRHMLEIDGEELVELDFTALHPNLFKKLCYKHMDEDEFLLFESFLDGDIYENIASTLDCERDEIKKSFLKYLNIKEYAMKYNKVDVFVKEYLPTMFKIISSMKTATQFDTDESHKGVCWFLMRNEVKLLEICMKKLHQVEIPCLQVYDAVLIPKSKTDEAFEIMNNTCSELGLNTRVMID